MKKATLLLGLLVTAVALLAVPANAQVSGAIFTTLVDGSEVNFNIYGDKNDVYLDGGPPVGAPAGAAGLPGPGTYVFMVTDPPGKTLLSTDAAQCREFKVDSNGVINGVAGPCPHATGVNNNTQKGGITVQLMPFNDTPNKGGVYKVWVTALTNYQCSPNLSTVDCSGGTHGFLPSLSKTDNFKVKVSAVREIDTRFLDSSGNFIDGLEITWIDTVGASNGKTSYLNVTLDVNHEAHVEAPEDGTHQIVVFNQAGCTVGTVYLNGNALPNTGPQTVTVKVVPSYKNVTLRVDVSCN
jgi:hypothetical protein